MGQHKTRSRKRTKLTPIHWALIGGAVLLAVAFYIGLSGQGTGGGTPAISVNRQVFDFGTVKFNTQLTFQVVVTNTGDGTLRFKEQPYVEVLEGC
ncbi:MAG: hypothetical protein HYZ26_14655 [Chloroflexi bacterium]|nr:hypothetical protein [Chloroflexota bacterium]